MEVNSCVGKDERCFNFLTSKITGKKIYLKINMQISFTKVIQIVFHFETMLSKKH